MAQASASSAACLSLLGLNNNNCMVTTLDIKFVRNKKDNMRSRIENKLFLELIYPLSLQ